MSDSRNAVLERVRAAIGPALEEDGFALVAAPAAAGQLRWEKPGDQAPAGEVDYVAFEVARGAPLVTAVAASWMGPSTNVRALDLEHREAAHDAPAPAGWAIDTDEALDAAIEAIAALVTGQLIGWLDEPVPLDRPKLDVAAFSLDGFALPGGDPIP